MPEPTIQNSRIASWKLSKQKQQLHAALIKSGFGPSHFIMGKLSVLRKEENGMLIEEFYLYQNSSEQKLLLRSLLYYQDDEPQLAFEPCGCMQFVIRYTEF